jgi:hypothetical protein
MKIIALLCALIGGALYLIGGVAFNIPPEVITRITSFYSGETFVKAIEIVRYITALGGLAIIGGGIVGFTVSKRIGRIIILIGCIGGLPHLFSVLWATYQAGVFSAPDFDVLAFFLRQGTEVMGTALSAVAYILYR